MATRVDELEILPQNEMFIDQAKKVSDTGEDLLVKYDITPRKKFNLIKKKGFPSETVFEQIISPKLACLKDSDKNSLLHLASKNNEASIEHIRMIIKNGCELDLRNNVGNTALHIALENKKSAISKFLVKSGAKVNIRNDSGITADSMNSHLLSKSPTIHKASLPTGSVILSRTRSGKPSVITASVAKQASKDIEKDISNVKSECIGESNKLTQKITPIEISDDTSDHISVDIAEDKC